VTTVSIILITTSASIQHTKLKHCTLHM